MNLKYSINFVLYLFFGVQKIGKRPPYLDSFLVFTRAVFLQSPLSHPRGSFRERNSSENARNTVTVNDISSFSL